MTYKFGETHQTAADLAQAIAHAEQQAADLRAALKLQQLNERNARTAAAIQASQQRTAHAQATLQQQNQTYPIHPNWKQHQTEANREIREWHAKRRGTSGVLARQEGASAAFQGVTGVVACLSETDRLASAFQGVS